MTRNAFIPFIGFAILVLSACGKKEASEPAIETPETAAPAESVGATEETAAPTSAEAAHGAELTKASSQGAAAEQAAGVFVRAAEGDPESVYLARCQYCHIQLGPGTITLSRRLGPEEALLANRTDLTEDYVKTVVRHGLNTMPALTRVEVSDAELELIAEYLTRNNSSAE
ncbi:c-type cytochrome [Hyphococcus sp.]|jgi:cytochrome c5|uniref:c-type cytochrome n=1 Tax=Hyphococcus sp. TaxID=2038636 RepID=UPI003D0DD031